MSAIQDLAKWLLEQSTLYLNKDRRKLLDDLLTVRGNATFYSFRESGKWYETGRGHASRKLFIETHETAARRRLILEENGDKFPGLSSRGSEFVWVVIPDEDADGFPILLRPALEEIDKCGRTG